MQRFFSRSIQFAEVLDAWRVVPRILVALYGLLVYRIYQWYKGIETSEKMECDNTVLNTLIENGLDPTRAMELTCTVVDVVGGPTTEQTVLVTSVMGLATAIFGFYVNTGRSWDRYKNSGSDFAFARRSRSSNPNTDESNEHPEDNQRD